MPETNQRPTDARVIGAELFFLPITLRVPLKFGGEVLTEVTCARARLTLAGRDGSRADGWGETPLSAAWAWPGPLPYATRDGAMRACCERLAAAWVEGDDCGHPIDLGDAFRRQRLDAVASAGEVAVPYLAALVCLSVFDQALHDAFGRLHGVPTYATYGPEFMSRDLSAFLEPEGAGEVSFVGKYPRDFLVDSAPTELPVWHLVGGLDPLEEADLTGEEPDDGHPATLRDWIATDGLTSLKVKLRGTDAAWDYDRLVRVGRIAEETGVEALCADFNCTVRDAAYVTEILDRLQADRPEVDARLLYIEQPFPYELDEDRIDATPISTRKPLLLDESAHDWTYVRLGKSLGWSGVALKTCKTQTGALLSLCWAKAHGMDLMVQDLTNPMLAAVPHVLLAAHAGTLRGVESNAMQFYPDASAPEAAVHPGIYRRRGGVLDLATLSGPGFGYRVDEIGRELPERAVRCGETS